LLDNLSNNKEFDDLTTPTGKNSHRYKGFREVVMGEEHDANENNSEDFSDERTMTREGRNSVSLKVKPATKPATARGDERQNYNWLVMVVPLGLFFLFIAALLYQHFQGDFCDSGIPEAEGAANCSLLRMSDGRQCRACPTNAVCKRSNVVKCNDGFKLLNKQICFSKDGSPMEENLLKYLIEMDASFQRGNTFKNWGSAEDSFITGRELIAHFTPKSETIQADETTIIEVVEKVLKTISQTGQDDYCLRNRFQVEQRDGSSVLSFNNQNEVMITSKRLGLPQDATNTNGK